MNTSLPESHGVPPQPITNLAYHGKALGVMKLHIVNLLLNIITLGIYSFWGKTRIRRYMTSHLSIQQDRFEYTGTGKELFYGWLKSLLIFLPIVVCMSIPLLNIPAFIVFFGILSVALYLSLRYRLSRTKWRGIRFHLGGNLKDYFVLCFKRTIINLFTLGWKVPKSDIMAWSYIANNMSYGDLKFSYEGDESRLQTIHLRTLAIYLLCMLVAFSPLMNGGFTKLKDFAENPVQIESPKTTPETTNDSGSYAPDDTEYSEDGDTDSSTVADEQNSEKESVIDSSGMDDVTRIIVFLYGGLAIGFIARLWYYAALWQEKFRGLRLGGLRFKADVTGKGLAILLFTNLLITILTLGLAKPIAAHRSLKFYAKNMKIGGNLQDLISQQEKAAQKSGMGDALAADVGFDMGM